MKQKLNNAIKRMQRMPIRNKITLIFALLLFVSVLITSLHSYQTGKKAITDRLVMQLESITVIKKNYIVDQLDESINSLNFVSTSEPVIEYMNSFHNGKMNDAKSEEEESAEELVIDTLGEYQKLDNRFEELFIIDMNGKVDLSTNPAQEGKIKTNDLEFINGLKGVYTKSMYYSLSINKLTITISAPIRNGLGEVVGVMAGRLNISVLTRITEDKSGLGSTGETLIVNNFNYVITPTLKNAGTILIKTINTDIVKKCLSEKNEQPKPELSYYDYNNDKVTGVYLWDDLLDVCIITKIDEKESFADIEKMRFTLSFAAFFMLIFSLILVFFFSSKITKPIMELDNFTKEIAKGNLDLDIKVDSHDELEDLAISFNKMKDEIKKSKDNLRFAIDEKTNQLQERVTELEKIRDLTADTEIYAETMRKEKENAIAELNDLRKRMEQNKKK